MKTKIILLIDAVIGVIFGVGLIVFPESLANFLGVPFSANHFYPSLLGATFLGISFALVIEYFRKNHSRVGLGYAGAAAIDLTIGIALGLWMIFGNLDLPVRGKVFLWALVIFLVGISVTEFLFSRKHPQ